MIIWSQLVKRWSLLSVESQHVTHGSPILSCILHAFLHTGPVGARVGTWLWRWRYLAWHIILSWMKSIVATNTQQNCGYNYSRKELESLALPTPEKRNWFQRLRFPIPDTKLIYNKNNVITSIIMISLLKNNGIHSGIVFQKEMVRFQWLRVVITIPKYQSVCLSLQLRFSDCFSDATPLWGGKERINST